MYLKKISDNFLNSKTKIVLSTLAAISVTSVCTVASMADPENMAPPISINSSGASDSSSVFNWKEIPQNQQVPLTREVFDQSGYQLFDTAGETILVPFVNNNLYVMKFAVSSDGTTFFVNTGNSPVLYLPRNGYLVNQSANGARWYPFTNGFAPADPVYLGCAPSWHAFIGMGWYPGMAIYGGYWCDRPSFSLSYLTPSLGLFFSIGGASYYGWHNYHNYYREHPAPFHTGFYDHDWNNWHDGDHGGFHGDDSRFRGGGDSVTHSFGGNSRFRGATGGGFSVHSGGYGGEHSFRGAGNSGWSGQSHSGSFQGGQTHTFSGGNHTTFQGRGTHSFSGGNQPNFQGGNNNITHAGGHGGFQGGGGHAGGGASHADTGGHGGGFGGGGDHGGGGGDHHH